MDFIELKTGNDDINRRIDKIIRIYLPDASLSEIYKYIRKGLIKINGKKIKSDYKICENDVINMASFIENEVKSESKKTFSKLSPLPPVVFQNQHLLILDKPYDLLVHGSEDSLDKIVDNYYKENIQSDSLAFRPGPLHRIDKKTTGLIAFSLSLKGAQWFTENIKNHKIQKKYIGIVQGIIKQEENWKDYITKDSETNIKGFHKVNAKSEKSDSKDKNIFQAEKNNTKDINQEKEALTTIIPLSYGKYKDTPVTYVEFDIKTGRTHQIRAQCGLHNHPLLGDTAYGGKKYSEIPCEFYLQAYKLIFPENPLDLPPVIQISPSKEFNKILKSCEIIK